MAQTSGRKASSPKGKPRAANLRLEADEARLMLEISRAFAAAIPPAEIAQQFASLMQRIVKFDRAVVNNIDWDSGTCTDFCVIGIDVPGKPQGVPTPLQGTLTQRVAEDRCGRLVQGLGHDEIVRDFPGLTLPYNYGLRSFVGAPLMLNGDVIGMIGLQSLSENFFSERDLWLCEQVTTQIAGAVSHSRLLAQARRQSQERSTLMKIGRLVDEAPDLYSTFEGVHSALKELLRFDRIAFSIVDAATNTALQAYVRGTEVTALREGSRFSLEESSEDRKDSARNRRPQLFGLPPLEVADEMESRFAAVGLKSIAATTLFARNRVIGIISVRSKQESFYSEEDRALLERVARQIAPAIENVRLREEAKALAERNYALARIGRVINSSRRIEEIYDEFASEVRRLIPCDHIAVSLADLSAGTFRDVYASGVISSSWMPGVVRKLKGTTTEQTILENAPVVINCSSPAEFASYLPSHSATTLLEAGVCSGLSVPLTHQGKTFGALHLRSRQPDVYTIFHAEMALSVAYQVAGAVANADLLARLEQEAKERSALAEIGRVFSSTPTMEKAAPLFAEVLKSILSFDRMVMKTFDRESWAMTDVCIIGDSMPGDNPGVPYSMTGTISETVARSRRPIRLPADPDDTLANTLTLHPILIAAGFVSCLNVPLIFDDRVIGTLSLRSRQESLYTAEHERFLERVAYQIAGAVMTSELVTRLEQEGKERAALAEIGRVFSSTLAIEKACPPFGNVLQRIVPFDRMVIKSFNSATQKMTDLCVLGEMCPDDRPGVPYSIERPVTKTVVAERRPIRLPASPDDEVAHRVEARSSQAMLGFNSMLDVPLVFDERVIGIIALRSHQSAAYTQAHERFLERVASQISGALANYELYGKIEQKAEEEMALAMLSRSASILLDIDQIIARSAGIVSALVPAEHISVNIVNPDGRSFYGRVMKGSIFWSPDDPTNSPLAGTITEATVRTGKTLWLVKEYEQESHQDFPAVKLLVEAGVRASITVPLVVEQAVIGTLVFISKHPDTFTQAHVSIGERIASHMARALANAELHARTVKLAEEEALRAKLEVDNEKLRVGNEVKAQLLSNVSHELRTPLTSVLSFAYSLRRNPQGNLTELQLKQLDMIRRGGRILEMLISDLLTMSSMEAGKFKTNPEEFVLSDLISDVQGVTESIINTRGQRLEVESLASDAVVFGDRDRLAQVLFNLLNNASRYSDDGSTVTLKTGVDGDDLIISVKDEGVGISPEDKASLFTRFFRADNEITRTKSGTGLGLYISRSIVEMHGGRIWVESTPGTGSEFSFRIPVGSAKSKLEKSA